MSAYVPTLSEPAKRWLRFAAVLAGALLLTWLALRLRGVLTPVVAALAAAYVLNPLVRQVERRGVERLHAVIGIFGAAFVAATVGLYLLTGTAISQVDALIGWLTREDNALVLWLRQNAPNLLRGEDVAEFLRQRGAALAQGALSYGAAIFSNVLYWVSACVLFPVYLFFFLWNYDAILRAARDHLPSAARETVVRVATTIDRSVAEFFRGRLVVCAAVGLLTGVGWLICGIPYSLPMGLLVGLLNLVPFLSFLALPPMLLLAYVDAASAAQNWVLPVLLVVGVFLLVQAIENFALQPLIMARSSGLHPVTTVIALLVGGEVAGLLGMLLAIPIASTLKSLGLEFVMPEIRRLAGIRDASGGAEPLRLRDEPAAGAPPQERREPTPVGGPPPRP